MSSFSFKSIKTYSENNEIKWMIEIDNLTEIYKTHYKDEIELLEYYFNIDCNGNTEQDISKVLNLLDKKRQNKVLKLVQNKIPLLSFLILLLNKNDKIKKILDCGMYKKNNLIFLFSHFLKFKKIVSLINVS